MARTLGLDHATLHVHVGLAIWVTGVAVAGDVGAWWPLALCWAAELANEGLDRLRNGDWRWADTLGDVANSVAWPCVLFALARAGVV